MPKEPHFNLARQQMLLERRRAELLGRVDCDALAERGSPEVTEGPRDTHDAGDESVYETAEDDRLDEARRATDGVRLVDLALQRITEGTYGTCTECGEPIEERRLLTLPEAALCTNCQEMQAERQGGERHATL